ncbi:hypothetical protein [Streptomyces sp. NPDC058612]|uniref:hypothetical protein n=1 Tax=Streptomyces sp. NPDC058612 TaxID=3346555 RepID=UPI0036508E25
MDPQAGENAAVLAAYGAMTAAEERSYATAKVDPELGKHATDTALADIQATVFWHQQDGTVMRGSVKHAPVVSMLDASGDALRAEITDCADSGDYDEVKADGTVMPYSGSRRYVVTSTAQRDQGGSVAGLHDHDRARPHVLSRPRLGAAAMAVGLLWGGPGVAAADDPGGAVVCPPRKLNRDVTAQNPGKPSVAKPPAASSKPGGDAADKASCAIDGRPVPCSTPDMGTFSAVDSCY